LFDLFAVQLTYRVLRCSKVPTPLPTPPPHKLQPPASNRTFLLHTTIRTPCVAQTC
jgi:hypothetical protein